MVLSAKEILHRRILYTVLTILTVGVGYMFRLDWLEEKKRVDIALQAGFKATPKYPLPTRSPEFNKWFNGPGYLKWKEETQRQEHHSLGEVEI